MSKPALVTPAGSVELAAYVVDGDIILFVSESDTERVDMLRQSELWIKNWAGDSFNSKLVADLIWKNSLEGSHSVQS